MLISALRAWLQPTQPSPIDALIYETIPQIIVSFLLCLAIDHALVSKLGLGKARWFSLHTIVNAIVCILAAEDTLSTLLDPIHACEGPVSTLAISLVISLHAYHSVYFTLDAVDILHHIVSVGILGPLAVLYRPGPFVNYACFFVSGLPGGIDYAMLALVKHGRMPAMHEKYYNCKINVWMRGPALVIGAFLAYQSTLESTLAVIAGTSVSRDVSAGGGFTGMRIASLITAGVLLWNGQFFAERVIVNFGTKSTQSTAEMYAGGILPRNLSKRSLSTLARNLSRESLLRLAEAN